MKKIAFGIQKGGVGKSTLSGNVSHCASFKKKTCLVDCDPQGNSSSWYITDSDKANYELADVLTNKVKVKDALVELSENLYIIPTFSIDGGLKDDAETKLFKEPYAFEDLCDELKKLNFEIAIFDLSPSMSQLERTIISSVDEVITPLTPEFFSLDGIEIFTEELKKLNKSLRKNVKHKKIVCNNMNKSFVRHKEIYSNFKKLKYELFTIPQDAKLAESQLAHKSIFDFFPESKSIPEIKRLTEAIIWH